jgi:DNA-binding MarR family transcriptional regulator
LPIGWRSRRSGVAALTSRDKVQVSRAAGRFEKQGMIRRDPAEEARRLWR